MTGTGPTSMAKCALITGVTGQDGAYLAEYLLGLATPVSRLKPTAIPVVDDHRGKRYKGVWRFATTSTQAPIGLTCAITGLMKPRWSRFCTIRAKTGLEQEAREWHSARRKRGDVSA